MKTIRKRCFSPSRQTRGERRERKPGAKQQEETDKTDNRHTHHSCGSCLSCRYHHRIVQSCLVIYWSFFPGSAKNTLLTFSSVLNAILRKNWLPFAFVACSDDLSTESFRLVSWSFLSLSGPLYRFVIPCHLLIQWINAHAYTCSHSSGEPLA